MFIDDYPLNYLAILVGGLVYFIIGAIWYAPGIFGHRWLKHDELPPADQKSWSFKAGAYIGEFILDLIIAYVLALFLLLSGAERLAEGAMVALWAWIGFIATTHFSAVLWSHRTLKNFFIHAIFMLVALIATAITIVYLS